MTSSDEVGDVAISVSFPTKKINSSVVHRGIKMPKSTLWTVNDVLGKPQDERCLGNNPQIPVNPGGLSNGSFPEISLTVHSVCNEKI